MHLFKLDILTLVATEYLAFDGLFRLLLLLPGIAPVCDERVSSTAAGTAPSLTEHVVDLLLKFMPHVARHQWLDDEPHHIHEYYCAKEG